MAGMQCEADDELSRSSLPSEGSEDNSVLNGSNNLLDDLPYNDLAEFAQLVEDHLALISDPARVEQGWRNIFAEGKESDYDWADEEWTNGEKLFKQLQAKAEVWHKASRASEGRAGVSHQKYENIFRYLKTGEYPEEMEGDWRRKERFRRKCEPYFLHTNGMLGYCFKGSRKYVLLEGEVEDALQQIHRALGHSETNVTKILENNFFADCSLGSVVKRLSTCAVQDENTVLKKDVSRVTVCAERVCKRLSVQVYLDGVQRTKSTKNCLQVSNENGEVGMPLERYKEFRDFARRGYVPERYTKHADFRKSAAKYTWSAQGLVTVAGAKLVLNHSDAVGVLLQLHKTYGHVPGRNLPDLLRKRFDCLGLQWFCQYLLLTCPFCMLRGKNYNITTPREFYSNARYDVDVKWEGEKRIISINPIGLDKKAVAKYVERIEKECGGKNKDKLPADQVPSTDANANVYKKVLSIADLIVEKERSRLRVVNQPADTSLNCHVNSERDAENRPYNSVSSRRDRKRKVSPMRNTALSAHTMLTRKKARSSVDRTVVDSFGISEPDSDIENSANVSVGETQPEMMDQTVDDVPSEQSNDSRDLLDEGQVAMEPSPIHEPQHSNITRDVLAEGQFALEPSPVHEEPSSGLNSANCGAADVPIDFKPAVGASEVKKEKAPEWVFVPLPRDEQSVQFLQEEVGEFGSEPELGPAVSQEHGMQDEPSLLDLQSERDALKRERANLEREKLEFELWEREKNHVLNELAAAREKIRQLEGMK